MTSSEKESQDMNTLDRHFLIWQFENFAPNILRIVTFLPNLVFMGSIKLQIKFLFYFELTQKFTTFF